MAQFDELKVLFVRRIYEIASKPGSEAEFPEKALVNLLNDVTGGAIARAVFDWALQADFLNQGYVIDGYMHYRVTHKLIETGEQLLADGAAKDRYGFSKFRDFLIVALAEREQSEGPLLFDLKEIADSVELTYDAGWVRKAAEFYESRGFVKANYTISSGHDGGLHVRLTADGLEYAESLMDGGISLKQASQPTVIPASDRVVTLHHNSAEYQDSVKKIDDVILAVAGDNEFGAAAPEEKAALVGSLKSGRILMESSEVKIAAINSMLLPALRYVADNSAQGAIRALAGAAVLALVTLLGITIL